MKQNKNKIQFICVMLLLVAGVALQANKLAVAPAAYSWKNAEAGRRIAMPMALHIKNNSQVLASYSLRAVNPADIDAKLEPGFSPLESVDWVTFSKKHIVVNPGQVQKVTLFLTIPAKNEFKGKKWQFYVEVKEHSEFGKMFNLACYPKISVWPMEHSSKLKKIVNKSLKN